MRRVSLHELRGNVGGEGYERSRSNKIIHLFAVLKIALFHTIRRLLRASVSICGENLCVVTAVCGATRQRE